jgi:hypothetical protein
MINHDFSLKYNFLIELFLTYIKLNILIVINAIKNLQLKSVTHLFDAISFHLFE